MGEMKTKKFFAPAERPILAIDATLNGELLAVGQQSGNEDSPTLSLVNLETGVVDQIVEKTTNHEGSVYQLVFHPEGDWLLYVVQQDDAFHLKTCDLSTYQSLNLFELGMEKPGLAIDVKGDYVAAGQKVFQFNQKNPQESLIVIEDFATSPDQPVQIRSTISPDGNAIAISGPEPGSIAIYDRNSNQNTRTLRALFGNVGQLGFDSSSQYVAASDYFGRGVFIWNVQTGKRYLENIFNEEVVQTVCLKLSSTAGLIALGHVRGYVDLYNLKNGEEMFSDQGHRGRVEDICFALNDTCLISGGEDHQIIARWLTA